MAQCSKIFIGIQGSEVVHSCGATVKFTELLFSFMIATWLCCSHSDQSSVGCSSRVLLSANVKWVWSARCVSAAYSGVSLHDQTGMCESVCSGMCLSLWLLLCYANIFACLVVLNPADSVGLGGGCSNCIHRKFLLISQLRGKVLLRIVEFVPVLPGWC